MSVQSPKPAWTGSQSGRSLIRRRHWILAWIFSNCRIQNGIRNEITTSLPDVGSDSPPPRIQCLAVAGEHHTVRTEPKPGLDAEQIAERQLAFRLLFTVLFEQVLRSRDHACRG